GPLPGMTELLESVQHGKESEVHRAHVERCDLWLEQRHGLETLFDGHCGRATGRDVDHAIRALLDDLEERRKALRRLVRPAVRGIASVKMDNCRPRFGRAYC